MAKQQVKKMTSKYREIMRRIVCGEAPALIKRDMRISDSNYSIITHSELFQEELKQMEADIRERVVTALGEVKSADPVTQVLQNAAVEAAEKDVQHMRSGSERVSQLSAWDILDRTGYKPKEHYLAEGTIQISGKVEQDIKQALLDMNITLPIKEDDNGSKEKDVTDA